MLKNIAVLVLSAILGGYVVMSSDLGAPGFAIAAGPPDAGAPMPASVAAAIGRDVTEWSEFSGRLRAAEDVQVRPRVSGTIDAVHFDEGDIVQKGDSLFTIDLRPYRAVHNQAKAALSSALARADLANAELKRAKELLAERAISQREYDERYNSQREASAAVQSARAALDLAALDLEYAEIRAPITGRVGRPDITVGNIVQAGVSILTTLQSVDPVYADFDVDEQTYLRLIKDVRGKGSAADMPVYMALADETEFTREGLIRSFDNQLSGDSGTIRARAEFRNTEGLLTPGLFARIRLGRASASRVVLVNDSAINTDQSRKVVYVVDAEGNVQYRPVTLGKLNSGLRIIESGLAEGENIVVNGLMRVRPGIRVQPVMVSMVTLQPEGQPATGETGEANTSVPDDAAPFAPPAGEEEQATDIGADDGQE